VGNATSSTVKNETKRRNFSLLFTDGKCGGHARENPVGAWRGGEGRGEVG